LRRARAGLTIRYRLVTGCTHANGLDFEKRIAAVLVTILFAVPSSGGVYSAQTLPRFFRFLGDWLPRRRMTDGGRSLTFYDGNGAAGLGTAVWVLALYLVGFTPLTLLVVSRRREARTVAVPSST
jgi:hypothetical protein